MTTLTAAYEAATAAVLLTVTPGAGQTVTELVRSDANGAGVSVRAQAGQLPSSAPVVLRDYEAAHGLVTYAALDGTAGATASLTVTLAGPRFAAVVSPQVLALPELVTGYTAGRAPRTTVHEVIDRPDPLVVLGPLGSRAGRLEVWCASYDRVRELVAVYALGEVALLRQADYQGLDLYHVLTGALEESPAGTVPGRWLVTIPYREVRRPADPLRGALGWTYATAAATHGTYTEVARAYPTYADLQVGPL